MAPKSLLPPLIRQNNPGWLRAAYGPDIRTKRVDGYCAFETVADGTESFLWCIWGHYVHLRKHTLRAILPDLFPATKHDLSIVARHLADRLQWSPSDAPTRDLKLALAWPALNFTRAVFQVLNGPAPRTWPCHPAWVSIATIADAQHRVGKWR